MASINKVTLIGNLGSDIELRKTGAGMSVGEMSIATSYGMGDKEETEWHKVTVWDKTADNCAKFLKKGSQVYVEGRIKTEKYEKDGVTRYTTKIVASEVKFLGGKADAAPPAEPATSPTSWRLKAARARGQSNSPQLPADDDIFG